MESLLLSFLPMLLSGFGGGGATQGGANPLSSLLNVFAPFSGSAPPSPTTGGGAAPLSMLNTLTGGIVGGLVSAFTGPGAGEIRRSGARALVAKTPGLARLKDAVAASGASTADQILAFLTSYLPRDTEARKALGQVMARAQQLGGTGKLQGEEANAIGDVLKWVLLQETVTKRMRPTDSQLLALLNGGSQPAAYAPQPYGSPAVLPVYAPTASSGSYWASMRTAYTPRAFSSLTSYVGGF